MFQLPTISVNFGVNHFMGDVALGKSGSSPITQFGYQLAITQPVTKYLNASFTLYTGSVRGEEFRDSVTNLNFRTTLFSQQVSVEYNFYPLLKPKEDGRQLVRPYVGFGVGLLSFRSKGDLKNAAGVDYQYWSDGTIRAEIEGSIDPSESTILARDFEYETDLRDANLDGLRKYSQLAFTLPINAGVRFQVSKNIGVNAAFTYAFNFTDMIDNISNESVGIRQGDKGFDNHLFGSIGVSVFLGRTKHSSKSKRFENLLAADSKSESKEKGVSESNEETTSLKEEQTETDTPKSATDAAIADNASIPNASASERKLTQVQTKKKDVQELKTAIDQQLKELDVIKKEIASGSKLKKPQLEKVKEQLQTANSNIQAVGSVVASDKQETSDSETGKEKTNKPQVDVNKEISSKEVALSSLAELSRELKTSINTLRKEEKELAKVEYKLNSFNIITNKVRLMEEMNAKDDDSSSIAEEDKLKAIDATLAEIRAIEQDSLYDDIIERSEIEQLVARVEAVKLPGETTEQEVAQSDSKVGKGNVDGGTVRPIESTTNSSNEVSSSEPVSSSNETEQPSSSTTNANSENGNRESAADKKLAEVVAKKSDIAQLKTAANQQLKTLDDIKKELSGDSKFKKAEIQKVNEQLQSAYSNLRNVEAIVAVNSEENGDSKAENTEVKPSAVKEVSSKEEAITSINELTGKLNTSLGALRNEEKELAKEQSKLNTFNVIRAKVRLMEKMKATDSDKSSMSEEERVNAMDAVLAEISALAQDSSFDNIIERSEIEVLVKRVEAVKLPTEKTELATESVSSKEKPERNVLGQDSAKTKGTAGSGKSEPASTKDNTNVKAKPATEQKTTRTVEDINNTPPKESGGFHWADVNKNGMISPDEVLYFIDALFEGESKKTVDDIQNLIDYYFDQE